MNQKGVSQIVSFVLILAIGSIAAVGFFYVYSATTSEVGSELRLEKDTTLSRLKSSLSLFAPLTVRNSSTYYAAVYNSGLSTIRALEAKYVKGSITTTLTIKDKTGQSITVLEPSNVAFIEFASLPTKNGVLLVESPGQSFDFKVFNSDVLEIIEVNSNVSALNSIDSSNVTVSLAGCVASNSFEFDIGMDSTDITNMYVEGYGWGAGKVAYFNVTDVNGDTEVIDSLLTSDRFVFDVSDANVTSQKVTLCVNNFKGNDVVLDLLRLVVVF